MDEDRQQLLTRHLVGAEGAVKDLERHLESYKGHIRQLRKLLFPISNQPRNPQEDHAANRPAPPQLDSEAKPN